MYGWGSAPLTDAVAYSNATVWARSPLAQRRGSRFRPPCSSRTTLRAGSGAVKQRLRRRSAALLENWPIAGGNGLRGLSALIGLARRGGLWARQTAADVAPEVMHADGQNQDNRQAVENELALSARELNRARSLALPGRLSCLRRGGGGGADDCSCCRHDTRLALHLGGRRGGLGGAGRHRGGPRPGSDGSADQCPASHRRCALAGLWPAVAA